MNVTLMSITNLNSRVRTFWLKPEKPYSYIAGQFAELYLPHAAMDTRGDKRWFTLSSSPTEPLLGITADFYDAEGSSFKRALWQLQPGQTVQVSEPLGDFVAPKNKDTPLLFIAGGIGITPVRSIVRQLQDTHDQRHVYLWHSVADKEDLYFENLFTSYPMHYEPISRQSAHNWKGQVGRITPQASIAIASQIEKQHIAKPLIYLSGPEAMAETLYEALKKSGVPNHRLILDFFPGYTEA